KNRWERTGNNSTNDLYGGNVDWVLTPRFFLNIQAGYWITNSTTPAEFAGTNLIHSFGATNQCTGTPGSSTCPFPEIPSNLQFVSGYSDNKSTSRTIRDAYPRTYVNANTTWFKSFAGDHQFKFGVRFERL